MPAVPAETPKLVVTSSGNTIPTSETEALNAADVVTQQGQLQNYAAAVLAGNYVLIADGLYYNYSENPA